MDRLSLFLANAINYENEALDCRNSVTNHSSRYSFIISTVGILWCYLGILGRSWCYFAKSRWMRRLDTSLLRSYNRYLSVIIPRQIITFINCSTVFDCNVYHYFIRDINRLYIINLSDANFFIDGIVLIDSWIIKTRDFLYFT